MKNLEGKMNKLLEITSTVKLKANCNSQIKGKLQLKDWNETINFICTKFDKYEKERKEREQIIKNMDENVSVMNKKVEHLEKEIGKDEQRCCRNCLLVHVHEILETDGEVTDDLVIETVSTSICKNIFACLFSIHNTISLSRHEQVCLSRICFERHFSPHWAFFFFFG